MADLPPLFSFVATSRNDDHGGDVLRRTQSFVRRLAEQAERHQLRSELILVDWNPPAPRAPLADVLDWPEGTAWFSARVVTVPSEIHRSMRHAHALQIFQMIAKNAGIRRADGEWVVATNIDIVFSDELFQYMKTAPLDPGVLYRSDRWDMPNEIQLEPDLEGLLERARVEAIRRNLKDGTHVRQPDGSFKNSTPPPHVPYFVDPVRWQLDRLMGLLEGKAVDVPAVRERVQWIRNEFIEEQARYASVPPLHTNGCGDFTMLSRYGWGRLRGYPEWQIFSWAIDSVLLYQAHYNRMRICELPPDAVHFHIEHDHGSGWSPEGAMSLWNRMDQLGVPYLEVEDFKRLVFELEDNAADRRETVYNPLDWGYANWILPEEVVAAPGEPARPARARNDGPLAPDDPTEGMARTELPLAAAAHHPAANTFEPLSAGSDPPSYLLRTAGPQWGYALTWELDRADRRAEYWLEITAHVREGRIGVGVLNEDRSAFLSQTTLVSSKEMQRVTIRVRPNSKASSIVCRNSGLEQAEVELRSIAILDPAHTAV